MLPPLYGILESPRATNLKAMQMEAVMREEKLYYSKLHSALRKKVPECTCYSCMEEEAHAVGEEPAVEELATAYAAVMDTGSVKLKIFDTPEQAETKLVELIREHIEIQNARGNRHAQALGHLLAPVLSAKKEGWFQEVETFWKSCFPLEQFSVQVLPVKIARRL